MSSYLDNKKRLEQNLKNSKIRLRDRIKTSLRTDELKPLYQKKLYHSYKLERFKGNKKFKGMSNQDLFKKAEIYSRYQGGKDYREMYEKYKSLK